MTVAGIFSYTFPSFTFLITQNQLITIEIPLPPDTFDDSPSLDEFASLGTLTSILNNNQQATFTYSNTASENVERSSEGDVIITVNSTINPGNTPPTLINSILDQQTTQGDRFSFQIPDDTFEDTDGDILTYSIPELADWLTFDPQTLTLSGTPELEDVGTVSIDVEVADGNSGFASDRFNITVELADSNNGIIDVRDFDGSNGFVINNFANLQELGGSVSVAGDINNDGIDDVIIGADGISYVLFGNRDGFSSEFDLSDLNGNNGFVISAALNDGDHVVSDAGDVNGDSIDDFIVNDSVSTYVIFGQTQFSANINLSELDGSDGFFTTGTDDDIFSDQLQAYYDDGNTVDYALISDFNADEDFIQLKDSRQDYRLEEQPSDFPDGTALYQTVGDNNELVAIIPGTPALSLEEEYFIFI